MKQLKTFLLFGIFCLFTFTSNAAVHTWLGGIGDWDDDANWDLGSTPTYTDGVIINSGTVIVDGSEQANYIHLDGGNLEVHGLIHVQPDIPWYGYFGDNINGIVIENGSSFDNYGNTVITQYGNISNFSRLIFCNGSMTNHSGGYLHLQGDESTGLHTYSQSNTVDNYGKIFMVFIKSGMYLINPFRNYGSIEILCDDLAIVNNDSFFSSNGSYLYTNGRISNSLNATWNQYGNVKVDYNSSSNAAVISTSNLFEIQSSGSLTITGSHSSVSVTSSGTLRVRGDLNITNDRSYEDAITNSGLIVNHQKGQIYTSAHYGVTNISSAEVRNYGYWKMEDPQGSFYCTLWNEGVFSNRPKGKLYVEGRLNLKNGSQFNNQGHMFVLDDVNHTDLSGIFNNTASLNDVHNNLSSLNNISIRVHKRTGPFTEGVPISNILDIGNNPAATVLSWYTSPTGSTLAGSYDTNTNTFTPNANAVGLNSLFVRTRINAGGVTHRHELKVENGINGSPNPLIQSGQLNNASITPTFNVAPNPINTQFSIHVENTEMAELNYSIYNLMGQKQSKGVFDVSSNSVEVPHYLPSGLYLLSVTDNEGRQIGKTKQIRVIR